ncbi:hypothetical protein [Streptomyces sp. FL07-04A]|uniref:hypothetical protein n=1 Tax=Streptomyces sp. FL07-04A TaxID=3028658 RepID=UPI0029BCC7E6|nr:hypothetical protein [Streptomyces sp. FL07-04A]MDX3579193.1 hypothetical protein [Streptomyces sp. FL07-04A]
MVRGSNVVLRDVLDIKEDAHAGDFKVALSQGFTDEAAGSVADYVVTEQLAKEFDKALRLVRGAVRKNTSYAAYLHGSFGAGKSHFLTVLHAVLNGDASVRAKPRLREVVGDHDDWLPGKKFLMVPYHLVGAANLDSALLDGYVKTVRSGHPHAATPAVFKADSLLADARALWDSLGDEAFVRLLPTAHSASPAAEDDGLAPIGHASVPDPSDDDELSPIGAVADAPWTGAELTAAFSAPAGDERRARLVSALLSGPMKSYAAGKSGDAEAFVPLDDGLSEISKHARSLGYDGVVLFLDELILWLQARMRDRTWVNEQIQQLVKLIESGNADRPVPIISFISRQRDLSQLIGKDILGSDVKNMEEALEYLKERFTVVNLEDRNLPEIIKERVLRPRPGQEETLESAFAGIDRQNQQVKDVLLDDQGATSADWEDFRAVYPLSPALLNVLVALSGALQRERSGLKLVQQLLEMNAGAPLGKLVPLGDLWDVLVDGTGAAFTEHLKHESEQAEKFYAKARQHLLDTYGSAAHADFVADDLFVKTLLLAALAPDVPALRRLTGARLAALNHGSVRSRTVPAGDKVIERMRALQGEFPTEVRAEGDSDPVFSLHLSDLDIEPLLDNVAGEDKPGARRVWVRDQLWELFGVNEGQLLSEKEIVWRGTRRTVEFVFGNVRDQREVADEMFTPSEKGNVRIVLDYPWDEEGRFPSYDYQRVKGLQDNGLTEPTLVWLPDFFSEQRKAQLGQLMRINFLLERNRLGEYTRNYAPDDRAKARRALEVGRDTLTRTLVDSLGEVYGISQPREGTKAVDVTDGRHVLSLQPEFPRPEPEGGKTFADNVLHLADGMFRALYPKHPDFGPDRTGQRRAVTQNELRTALEWITRAMDQDGHVQVDSSYLPIVKRIVEPLELGTVHDGPLVLRADWRTRINQAAHQHQERDDLSVENVRTWITSPKDLGYAGLDRHTTSLLIAAYALFDDRAWVRYNTQEDTAPDLTMIGPGWALRSQPKPGKEEYEAARERAARLFGAAAKPNPYTRNVNKLAADVRAKAETYETNVAGVRATLERHAALLGLDGDTPAPRTAMLREAAGLLARLGRHGSDATGLVKELAAVTYESPDRDLAHTMDSAGEVLRALDATDWRLLSSVRGLSGRDDSVGDRAGRLLARLTEAARASEFERSLVPVLDGLRETAMAVVDAALKVERTAPLPSPEPAPGPEQVPLTEHGNPPVSSQPTEQQPTGRQSAEPGTGAGAAPQTTPGPMPGGGSVWTARRVIGGGSSGLEARLVAELGAIQREIEEFRAQHPDTSVEIVVRSVDGTDEGEGSRDTLGTDVEGHR